MSKCIYTQEQFDKILEERNELANENFKLKQHPAEREKEVERWKEQYFTEIGALSYAFNQAFVLDKISFALEQLEKVKELCIKDMTICEDYFAIEKILDNQIKQLKEGK